MDDSLRKILKPVINSMLAYSMLLICIILPAVASVKTQVTLPHPASEITATRMSAKHEPVTLLTITSSGTATGSKELKAPEIRDVIFNWLQKLFGKNIALLIFVALVVIAFAWWKWETIADLPGMVYILNWLAQPRIPRADHVPFLILVANFKGEKKRSYQKRFIAEIEKIENVRVSPLRRLIAVGEGNMDTRTDKGRLKAQQYLKKSGAQLLLWGKLVWEGTEENRVDVHFTSLSLSPRPEKARLDLPNSSIQLPSEFSEHLYDVIRLKIIMQEYDVLNFDGQYMVDRLRPLVAKVQQILSNSAVQNKWTPEARGFVLTILGISLLNIGDLTGEIGVLEEAVTSLRQALNDYSQSGFPYERAVTQTNLGTVLGLVGERMAAVDRLEQSVDVFQEALKVLTITHYPLQYAAIQNNLGSAYSQLGDRESIPEAKIARQKEAVTSIREALKVWTQDQSPLDWALAQNNLGNALTSLSECEQGTEWLEEAVVAFQDALKERKRDRSPIDWAMTNNNLGVALMYLGYRESGTMRLESSIAVYEETLLEWTRERVPLKWAATQNNMGTAARTIGVRSKKHHTICEALGWHLAAHEVYIEANHYNSTYTSPEIKEDLRVLREDFAASEYQKCIENHRNMLQRFDFV